MSGAPARCRHRRAVISSARSDGHGGPPFPCRLHVPLRQLRLVLRASRHSGLGHPGRKVGVVHLAPRVRVAHHTCGGDDTRCRVAGAGNHGADGCLAGVALLERNEQPWAAVGCGGEAPRITVAAVDDDLEDLAIRVPLGVELLQRLFEGPARTSPTGGVQNHHELDATINRCGRAVGGDQGPEEIRHSRVYSFQAALRGPRFGGSCRGLPDCGRLPGAGWLAGGCRQLAGCFDC